MVTTDEHGNTTSQIQSEEKNEKAPSEAPSQNSDQLDDGPTEIEPPGSSGEKDENVDQTSRPTRPSPALSKHQQKKLKRKQEWEAGREERKVRRKEKTKAKRQRLRENAEQNGTHKSDKPRDKTRAKQIKVPVTVLIDCQFDDLMLDSEIISLGGQITRCYSDNKKSKYPVNLVVSSFSGRLKERFDGLLSGNYRSWRDVTFSSDACATVADAARKEMSGSHYEEGDCALTFPGDDAEKDTNESDAEVTYLTSESPDTLSRLKPNSTYIIGGLVDRNRHKGMCYKRAMDQNIKTAKLPIGDYLNMKSRFVLATNHVNEILLKWLETGDWGESLMQVVPERKERTLKGVEEAKPSTTES